MAAVSVFVICVFSRLFLSTECSLFEDKVAKLQNIIKSVRASNALLKQQIGDIETRIGGESSAIRELGDRLGILQAAAEIQASKVQTLQDNSSDGMSQNTKAIPTSTDVKRQLKSPTVCFSAVISQADLTNLNSGTPVVFDHVITNVGHGYNATSGEFRAPISGVYVLNMDIMVMAGENEYLQFVKDNSHVMYNYAHASGALHDESSTRLVVLELRSGNKVWVRTAPGAHHGSGNLHGNGFSTFSGWLLAITE